MPEPGEQAKKRTADEQILIALGLVILLVLMAVLCVQVWRVYTERNLYQHLHRVNRMLAKEGSKWFCDVVGMRDRSQL